MGHAQSDHPSLSASSPTAALAKVDGELRRLFGELAAGDLAERSLGALHKLLHQREVAVKEVREQELREARAARPLASPAALDAFRERFGQARLWLVPATPAPAAPPILLFDERSALRELLDSLGALPIIESVEDARFEIERLAIAVGPLFRLRWRALPVDLQITFFELLVARLRVAQEHGDIPGASGRIVGTLTEYLQEDRLGIVHGLRRGDRPRRFTWRADAEALGRALSRVLVPVAAPAPSTVAPAVKCGPDVARAEAASPKVDPGKTSHDVFDGWAHLSRFSGGTALMFGGNPCPKSGESLRRGLRLSRLDWVDGGKSRMVESVVERVCAGSYSSVFINKFASHKDVDRIIEACKRAQIPYAVLRHGFGAHAVKSAVERALGEC